VGTYRTPDVDMRRYRRLGVRVAYQVDVIHRSARASSVRTPTKRLKTT
jgi:hypothetical protein